MTQGAARPGRCGLLGRIAMILMLGAAALPAAAQDAKCRNPDPASFDEVFACMSSVRYEKGMAKGRNAFEANIGSSTCQGIALKYLHAVRGSSPIREELAKLLPSCRIFAQAVEAFTGKSAFWATCTDYPGKFDPGHMRACLTEFVPRFYGGNRAPGQVKGCQGILEDYERALLAASGVTIEGRALRHKLPPGYVRPSCEAVADIFAATAQPFRPALAQGPAPRPHLIRTASASSWKQCLGFRPDNAVAHVAQCLGNDIARTSDCRSVRQLYEEKLQQAYGGELPPDYVTIPCAQLNAVLEEHQRRLAAARMQTPANEGAAIGRQIDTGRQASWGDMAAAAIDFRGFLAHLAVMGAFLFIAVRMIRSGAWRPTLQSRRFIFSPWMKKLQGFVQLGLLVFGIFFLEPEWNWAWLAGAVAAGLVVLLITQLMLLFGVFRPAGGLIVGAVGEEPPAPRPTAPRPPAPGQGDGWL